MIINLIKNYKKIMIKTKLISDLLHSKVCFKKLI